MFGGSKFFTDVYANFTRHFIHPEIPKWWTDIGSSYNFVTENDIKVISAVVARFYVCIATEILVLGTVSASILHLMLLFDVGQCRYRWKRIRRALKHYRSHRDHLDIVFRRRVITTSGIRPPWNF